MTDAIVICLCGKRNKLVNGRSKKCRCGVVLSIKGKESIPIATIPENSLEERKRRGKQVVNDAPRGWWR